MKVKGEIAEDARLTVRAEIARDLETRYLSVSPDYRHGVDSNELTRVKTRSGVFRNEVSSRAISVRFNVSHVVLFQRCIQLFTITMQRRRIFVMQMCVLP